ncbi:extracellular solute-binding protein [Paenibacillus sp. KQZ6P-2]|uniref:Extracellular solute-binding protein n=1 Tax=Paenibacillus mangrovi TaxID=2931978 RepID=A0A9X1WTP4_9BACL|nr:extracellular solute-binding protein [Paenibacillus mangrovi]MCJ8013430.1 extracellular solute-binding protein [Paenibacillus mangrovi]
MKKAISWISLLIVLSIVLAITACGSGKPKNAASTEESSRKAQGGEAIKLRIAWAGSQARHDATLKALDLYTKKNPNVSFEPEFSGFDGYYEKLTTQSAAKNAPDIMQIDTYNIVQYASRGQLADLSSVNVADVDPNLVSAGKYKEQQVGIPLGKNATGFIYNKAVLDKLGVKLSENMTWDDLFKLARDIQPKLEKGKYSLADLSMDPDAYEMFQLSKGKGFAHTADGKFNIDHETWTEFNAILDQLRKEGVVPPADITVTYKQFDPKQDLLLNGTVLFLSTYAAGFGGFDNVSPNTFALTPAPSGEKSGGWLVPSQFFTVSSNSKHAEEAKKFLEWFINDTEAADALMLSRGVPVSAKVLEYVSPKLSGSDKAQIELLDKTAANANKFSSRPNGYWNFRMDFIKIMQEVAFGKTNPDLGFEAAQKKYAELIKE